MKKAALFLILLNLLFYSHGQEYTVYTDPFPPYNYLSDTVPRGISVELVEKLLHEIDPSFTKEKILFIPWARGHKIVEETPYTILMTAARTESRESLFRWIGPVTQMKIGVVMSKEMALEVESLEELKDFIGTCVNNSAPHQMIKAAGFPEDQLYVMTDPEACLEMFRRGRVDFFVHTDISLAYLMAEKAMDTEDYRMNITLRDLGLYLALSNESGEEVEEQLQNRFLQLSTPEGSSWLDGIKDQYIHGGIIKALE